MTGPQDAAALRLAASRRRLREALQPLQHSGPESSTVAWVAGLARDALQVAVQDHPIGTVLGAAAVGGGLVLIRPWRWAPPAASLIRWLVPVGMKLLAARREPLRPA